MSSLVRRNSIGSQDTVRERRLRPIYELLDSANNKKVIQEADRLLKKQPGFTCVKVLKGLAFLRMGKKEECLALIDPVFEEVPTDENTIQALSICYRELDRPDLVCVLVENACKKEKSEDLLTFCYMAHVRVLDFQKQHQTAMILYKAFPKVPYFSWAIMSLYVKSMQDPPETAMRMTLPLAERMMSKFLDEGKINAEHEIVLYLMILFKQNKHIKALEVLQGVEKSGVKWTTGTFTQMMLTCLSNINDETDKLLDFLELLMLVNPEDFQYFRQYVHGFGETYTDRVTKFLQNLTTKLKTEYNLKPRSAVLSRLLLFYILQLKKIENPDVHFSELVYQHFTHFGGKPFFLKDIHAFLRYFVNQQQQEDLITFIEKSSEMKPADSIKVSLVLEKLQKKTNISYIKHFFQREAILSDPFKILQSVSLYVKNYMECREELITSKINLDPREVYPQDDYLVLASLTLMETYWNYPDVWKGFYLSNDMRRFGLKTNETGSSNTGLEGRRGSGDSDKKSGSKEDLSSSTNGILIPVHVSDPKFNLPEEDFPILLSMALLEYGLERNQCCSQLRILLGKVYTFCGAVVAGTEQFMRLDIKHAQVESLGYLYLWKTLGSGSFSDAFRVLSHAEAFYSSHHKESMEHVISAYKYGSWAKILEFMDFRDKIVNSVQSNLVKVEKQLLEYTHHAFSHELTIKVAYQEEFDVKTVVFNNPDRFRDERDFRILNLFHKEAVSTQLTELTFKDDVARLKVRGLYLSLMTTFVRASVEIKDEAKDKIKTCGELLELLEEVLKDDFNEYNVAEPYVHGPWPPKMHMYQSLGILAVLANFYRVLYCAAVDPSGEEVSPVLDLLERSIVDIVTAKIKEWQSMKYLLINFSKVIDEVYSVIECLGFCCILTDVLKTFLQKSSSVGTDAKSKKRKAKEVAAEAVWTLRYNSLVKSVSKSLKTVEDQIADFKFASGSWYPCTWLELQSMWKSKVSDEILNNVLPYCLPTVTDKLNTSYCRAFAEIKLNAACKRKYIDSLLLNSPASQ